MGRGSRAAGYRGGGGGPRARGRNFRCSTSRMVLSFQLGDRIPRLPFLLGEKLEEQRQPMSKRSILTAAVLLTSLALVALGCAKPPDQEMQQAQSAMEVAKTAGAETYAAESLGKAQDVLSQAQAEVQAQQGKMFKSYAKAKELLAQAKTAADQAAADATTAKAQMKSDAEAALNAAKTALDSATQAVATAPASKDRKADLEAMQSDLATLKTLIGEADSAMASEDYAGAKQKADQVQQEAAKILADVQQAGAKKSPTA